MAFKAGALGAVIPAGGRGRRFLSRAPKLLTRVAGRPVLVHTLKNLLKAAVFSDVVVAASPALERVLKPLLKRHGLGRVRVVRGGATRAESVRRGVEALNGRCRWVLVHDSARPLVGRELVGRTLRAARRTGAALCALPATATVKRAERGIVRSTEPRERLWLAQTPQVFELRRLEERYRRLKGWRGATDEAALFDGSGVRVGVVPGEPRNIKITTREDLELMRFYLGVRGKG